MEAQYFDECVAQPSQRESELAYVSVAIETSGPALLRISAEPPRPTLLTKHTTENLLNARYGCTWDSYVCTRGCVNLQQKPHFIPGRDLKTTIK